MDRQKQSETTSPQKVAEKGRPKESSAFEHIFRRYASSIEALREFSSRLNPFITEMEKGIIKEKEADIKKIITAFGQRASKEEIEELKNFLLKFC